MSDEESRAWLVAFGEIEGLRWALHRRRMAWSSGVCPRAARIRPGDGLALYVTRGAFHNPTRDHSQVAGLARVTTAVRRLRTPVVIAGREYVCGCGLSIEASLPERRGVAFEPLVDRMKFIRRKDVWGQYLRSGLVELESDDFKAIRAAVLEGS